MGRVLGGSKLEGELQDLRKELENYFGFMNEVRMGLTTKIPEPPEALVRWHQCQTTGLPLVAGGLLDQPHIWLRELAVVIEISTLFERINREQPQEQTNGTNQG